MHWEILIIPLIALGVWIIGTLCKSEDDKTKKGVAGRGNVSGRAPARRMTTDLDRFLEEARRRREPEERRKAPPAPARTPAPRPPLRERPPQQREAPRRPAAPPSPPPNGGSRGTVEEVLVALPAPRPVAPPPVPEPVAAAPQVREVPLFAPPAPVVRPAPIPEQVLSLLSKPQTAATAFVLREIFDRPLCKRRR